MKRKAAILTVVLALSLVLGLPFCSVWATDMDSVSQQTQTTDANGGTKYDDNAVGDYIANQEVVGQEQMQKASHMTSGITNLIGIIAGAIVTITSAAIFLVTALDLLYIAVPFTRSYLAPQQSGGGMSMGGGFGGGMMGGMGGMGAQQPAQSGSLGGKQWVSDEALACVQPAGGQGQMGGMPMGGFGGVGGQQQAPSTKSAITQYFKKRSIFIVIFAVCAIVLMSSVFTDCGINLAKLLFKIMDKVNNGIGNANF